jgi:hypothetical protein
MSTAGYRTAHKYSNPTGRERLREPVTGQRPAPATANDLAAESSHREAGTRCSCLTMCQSAESFSSASAPDIHGRHVARARAGDVRAQYTPAMSVPNSFSRQARSACGQGTDARDQHGRM